MSSIWELMFQNRIIYLKGTRDEVLKKCFPEKPVSIKRISKKDFDTILRERGVQKIFLKSRAKQLTNNLSYDIIEE